MAQPWILIPAHNRRDLTLACLRHLTAIGADRQCRILVIDDGSADGTAASVRAEFPNTGVLEGDGSLWWTGAIRAGMEEADRADAEAVLWLNDDCHPESGTIERLFARAAAGAGTIVGACCVTESEDRPVDSAFVGRTPFSTPAPGTDERKADGLSGFCVAVPQAVWKRIGLPDSQRFPHYFGDSAYTLLARKAGFDVALLGSARARLTHYRERAKTVAEFLKRPDSGESGWAGVFRSPKSPFRAATQWNYLRLRYGAIGGGLLGAARLAGWQLSFLLHR